MKEKTNKYLGYLMYNDERLTDLIEKLKSITANEYNSVCEKHEIKNCVLPQEGKSFSEVMQEDFLVNFINELDDLAKTNIYENFEPIVNFFTDSFKNLAVAYVKFHLYENEFVIPTFNKKRKLISKNKPEYEKSNIEDFPIAFRDNVMCVWRTKPLYRIKDDSLKLATFNIMLDDEKIETSNFVDITLRYNDYKKIYELGYNDDENYNDNLMQLENCYEDIKFYRKLVTMLLSSEMYKKITQPENCPKKYYQRTLEEFMYFSRCNIREKKRKSFTYNRDTKSLAIWSEILD